MKYFHVDLRALAFMRILIACVVLLDLGIRISDLEAFYTSTGVAPLSMLFQYSWNEYFISFHTISGLWQVQFVLFAIAAFSAGMMLLGYRTQLFTFLSWLMMLSLHNRNSLIQQGGDDLLRMILFWGIFLPWGARYSCDKLLDTSVRLISSAFISVASIAYIFQICYIYTGSALLKGAEWNEEYTAVYYAYSLDQISMPIIQYIYYYPSLLKKLTFIAYYFELLIPLVFFIPIRHGLFRTLGVLCIIGFHFINELTLFIGLFPLIGMVTVIGLLPSSVMDWIEQSSDRLRTALTVRFLFLSNQLQSYIPWKKTTYVLPSAWQNIQSGLLIFLIVFVFDWNFSNLPFIKSKLSDKLRFIGYGLRLDQNWSMFAPFVLKEDGWYIHEAVTKNNDTINLLFPDQKDLYQKPSSVVKMFKNDRWRKYSENLMFQHNAFMRGYYCNYVKSKWNDEHTDNPLKTVRIIYMTEQTLPDYKKADPVKNILWECTD